MPWNLKKQPLSFFLDKGGGVTVAKEYTEKQQHVWLPISQTGGHTDET